MLLHHKISPGILIIKLMELFFLSVARNVVIGNAVYNGQGKNISKVPTASDVIAIAIASGNYTQMQNTSFASLVPTFDATKQTNVSVLVGNSAHLVCRVHNLWNRSVSTKTIVTLVESCRTISIEP